MKFRVWNRGEERNRKKREYQSEKEHERRRMSEIIIGRGISLGFCNGTKEGKLEAIKIGAGCNMIKEIRGKRGKYPTAGEEPSD
ncbi:hypothetical protein TSUD_135740 [Trifolium subterraneum]|uniref:Uncharacterized protein n=1 Tax=Trifolium subterraneum TaxID=3900 RepID=A0A2Z6NYH2_TRISU|nr:hypothetical protein TSUD_135740 [Trifolium subterraneum]